MDVTLLLACAGLSLAILLAVGSLFRAGRSPGRWAFVAGMAFLAAERGCAIFLALGSGAEEIVRWQYLQLIAAAPIPICWLAFSLSYARGNASTFLRGWRPVLIAGALLPAVVFLVFFRDIFVSAHAVPNDSRLLFRLGVAGVTLQLIHLVGAVLILTNLEKTFRTAVGTARWRIKYMLMGVGALFLVRLYTASQIVLFRGIDPALDVVNSVALVMMCLLVLRSLFRSGHFSVGVYPSQSVLQGSVTVILAGAYLFLAGVLANVVSYLGGDSSFAVKALVVLVLLVLLAVLIQSDRVQLQLRRFVSRHFQRPLHDYRTVWQQFTEGTSSRVEQAEFCRAVVNLLAEIFQSLSVTLWVVDDHRGDMILAASTSLSERQADHLKPDALGTAAVGQYFQERPEPVDIEELSGEWTRILRHAHPLQFDKSSTRIAVPVMTRGQMLAVIILGDRVSGVAFTTQDLDLLKSISDQVASGLLNVRLSQRLLQAREHEAFQTMATFFVHDLKNAANTLNLMLQNLPTHFDDPEFRQDALRGVGKTVAHINHLISRLSQLRSELKIAPVATDLNQLVTEIVGTFAPDPQFTIEVTPGAIPRIPLDRDQLGKVVTNLILNAREAMNGPGSLRLTTSISGAWVILEAADNGQGMAPEFLTRSLFRPFQTTKKNGLGIGMFQSKMIVEAHGGRIAVESTPGQGTTFRIHLPARAAG
jgi:putative PEP-CTERM system histidine kinase